MRSKRRKSPNSKVLMEFPYENDQLLLEKEGFAFVGS